MDWEILEPLDIGTPIRVTRGYWRGRDGYVVLRPDCPQDARAKYVILVDRVNGILPGTVCVQRKSLENLRP